MSFQTDMWQIENNIHFHFDQSIFIFENMQLCNSNDQLEGWRGKWDIEAVS